MTSRVFLQWAFSPDIIFAPKIQILLVTKDFLHRTPKDPPPPRFPDRPISLPRWRRFARQTSERSIFRVQQTPKFLDSDLGRTVLFITEPFARSGRSASTAHAGAPGRETSPAPRTTEDTAVRFSSLLHTPSREAWLPLMDRRIGCSARRPALVSLRSPPLSHGYPSCPVVLTSSPARFPARSSVNARALYPRSRRHRGSADTSATEWYSPTNTVTSGSSPHGA